MAKSYLLLNAALYLFLAVWCTARHGDTSHNQGYLTLSNAGHSEYLVIYGGLQIGLAGVFTYLAIRPELHGLGVLLSVLFYAPIVAYRAITAVMFHPVGGMTLAIGALELVLLLAAIALYWKQRTI